MSDFLVKTSGQSLDLQQAKNNSVKTLMLLHGWGMNSHVWEPIRAALEAEYQLLWIDLPGHGFNRHVEAKNLDNMVMLIADTVSKNALENIHIIGWSLGGMVAQALAQQIPDQIASLTLVTSTPRFSQCLSNATSDCLTGDWQHAMSDEVLNRFADNLKQDTEKTLKGFIALQFIGVKDAKEAQDNLINHILATDKTSKKWGGVFLNDVEADSYKAVELNNPPTQEALDAGLTILKDSDLRSLTPTCPEHWLFAEYDRLIPKEVIKDLISLRPDAEITLLEKAGHAPFITHSELFLEQVINFIESQPLCAL